MTLALDGSSAWVACKEQSRLDPRRHPRPGKTPPPCRSTARRSPSPPAYGSVWALDSGATLYRIDPAKARDRAADRRSARARRTTSGSAPARCGSSTTRPARSSASSPAANRVTARIPVGDGPADMAFAGTSAWVSTTATSGSSGSTPATNRARRARDALRPTRPSGWCCSRAASGSPAAAPTCSRSTRRRARWSRRSRSARAGSTSSPAAVRSGCRREATRSTRPASRRWRRSAACRPRRARHDVATADRPPRRPRPRGRRRHVWLADNRAGTLYRLPAEPRRSARITP